MRVFVTGATGFVGAAVTAELLGAGHQVLGLARSEAAARSLAAAGAEVHRGSLDDPDSLRRAAAIADGVIHTAFVHDFSKIAAAGATDRLAIEVLGSTLSGSGRPLVVTSAVGVLAPGRLNTEGDAADPGAAGAHRLASERAALDLASRGVRVTVLRLPPSVHGDGDHGFVPTLIGVARDQQVSAYVGDGGNRWAAVHRHDAANLYRLALEQGPAGATFHGVAEEGILTRDIAACIGRHLNVPVASKSSEAAKAHFGWIARFIGIDMQASSARTREQLGWRPTGPGLLADLDHGSYFAKTE